MNLGEKFRSQLDKVSGLMAAPALALVAGAAFAQDTGAAPAAADAAAAAGAPAYTPLGPEMIKGQPTPRGLDVQAQYSDIGHAALPLHNELVWIMAGISALILILLLYVMIRYNRRANPVPSRTSHNTALEVVWTLVPILILVAIALPSINLIVKKFESPPADALTVKVTGYQWYWGYAYPDNGGFEVISNMMPEEEARAKGFPSHLEVDNRMVVPVGVPIRIQTIGADVIHSFAVPSLWFKLDAVPGRINELQLNIREPGIYYGQCSELCGARHGYMPIAIEAVPMEQFKAWVLAQGGTLEGAEGASVPAPAPAPATVPPAASEA